MALSRKTFLGVIIGNDDTGFDVEAAGPEGRLAATLAANLIALQKGARLLRVHDVAETVDMIKVYEAVCAANKAAGAAAGEAAGAASPL
jgi:dihydropteroate synthase